MTIETIHIEPMSRRNRWFFLILGLAIGLASLLLLQYQFKLLGLCGMMSALICVVLGISKSLEPKISLSLSPTGLTWFSKNGEIHIPWPFISGIQTLRVNKGQGTTDLHYFGIKLWDLEPIIETVRPRLAKTLFHEYRSLLHVALLEAQFRNDDASQLQEDTEMWQSSSGKQFDGIIGMFAARLKQLKAYLGADIYIPITVLDRDVEDFIVFAREYQDNVERHQNND